MHLKLTVLGDTGPGVDLSVTADPEATVGELAEELAAYLGAAPAGPLGSGLVRTLRRLDAGAPPGVRSGDGWRLLPAAARLADGPLASGATVALGTGPLRDPAAPTVAELAVVRGAGAGTRRELAAGTWVLGRDPRCDVVLADPMVSARHARLHVGERLELVDLGSANGTIVDGRAVGRATLRSDQSVVLGGTVLRVRPRGHSSTPRTPDTSRVIRSPRVEPRFAGERLIAPSPPEPAEAERVPWLFALTPLVIAVSLAVALGRPLALLIGLVSPVLLLGGWLTQRARRRHRARVARDEFLAEQAAHAAALERAIAAERTARHTEAPTAREVLVAVHARSPLLWTRRPEHEGFLAVRLGTARLPSRTTIDAADGPTRRRESRPELADLPVVAQLREAGALGIAGPPARAGPVLDGILIQLLGLNSPSEVVLAALVPDDWAGRMRWLGWVPHASSPASPLGELPHLAAGPTRATELLGRLEGLVRDRVAVAASGATSSLPAVVVLFDHDAPVPLERCIALSEAGPAVGVHPIWLAPSHERLPAACRISVEVMGSAAGRGMGTLRFVRQGLELVGARLEEVGPDDALGFARALAPLVDAAAPPAAADLPREVSLGTLLGDELLDDPAAVLQRWWEHDRSGARGLPAIIGVGLDGPVRLDLRAQGPHALVAGTTGAGKSELLRAWVLGLAVEHPPDRLTLLFVDYKGGTAFADCVRLPHCVGLVTDLGPREARRALVSLRAELRRRERIFARLGAKELVDLQARGDLEAPPALVIVVDEFAALAREIPEFVDGVLDLAQRGRALGMHLVLATQRPGGVVTDGVRANASLRIALRTAEVPDSLDVLGVPDAARLSAATPGRALLRSGAGPVEVVQTAYTGGHSSSAAPRVRLAPLGFAESEPASEPVGLGPSAVSDAVGPSDLIRLVATIDAAAGRTGAAAPRRPWLPELPDRVELTEVLTGDDTRIPLGVSDVPEEQTQRLAVYRPDRDGHLAVLGASGSGKSATLRALALAVAVTPHGGPVHVYGIDCASGGLRGLEALPHVGSIVPGDDFERVERLLRRLSSELTRRVRDWASTGVEALPARRTAAGGADLPRLLLLVDGFPAFREAWESRPGRAAAYDVFREILASGRSLGIHVALTADRAAALPSGVAAAVQRRVQLRPADDTGSALATAPPGRAVVDGLETQIGWLGAAAAADSVEPGAGGSPASASQAIAAYAARHRGRIPRAEPVRALPRDLDPVELPDAVAGDPVLGLAAETLEPLGFAADGVLLVAGPPGSGRTNALAWSAVALRRAVPTLTIVHLGPVGSVLAGHHAVHRSALGAGPVEAAVRELLATPEATCAIILESVASFLSTPAEPMLLALLRQQRGAGGCVIAEEQVVGWAGAAPLLLELRSARRGLVLQPEPGDVESLLRVALPRTSGEPVPPGCGLFVEAGRARLVQLPHMRRGSPAVHGSPGVVAAELVVAVP